MTRLRGTLLTAAVPLLLISACAQSPGNSAAGAPASRASSASSSPDDLVLRVESVGGFVPAERIVGRIPQVSIYADGRMITEGPVPAIYPGPALPNIQQQMLSPAQVQELVAAAPAAGVRSGTDFGSPPIADAPSTRVTVVSAGYGLQAVSVEALAEAQPDDPSLTPAQRDARAKLGAFVKKVRDLPIAPGLPPSVAYRPTTVAALTRAYEAPQGGVPASPAIAWSGPALPGAQLNPGADPSAGFGCVEVTGDQLTTVLAAAEKATRITPWTYGGKKWAVTFRPMLPDEAGCATLKGQR